VHASVISAATFKETLSPRFRSEKANYLEGEKEKERHLMSQYRITQFKKERRKELRAAACVRQLWRAESESCDMTARGETIDVEVNSSERASERACCE